MINPINFGFFYANNSCSFFTSELFKALTFFASFMGIDLLSFKTSQIVLFTVKKSSKNKKEVAKFLISMLQRKQNE